MKNSKSLIQLDLHSKKPIEKTKMNEEQESSQNLNEKTTLEKDRQEIIERIETLEKKRTKMMFEIALDAKTGEVNRTKKLIMILLADETTARKNRKDLELDLKSSQAQMDELEKEYIKI